MFQIISENFFVPLASPNKAVYWECLVKLFSVMNHQLSFGMDRVKKVITIENLTTLFLSSKGRVLSFWGYRCRGI